MAYQKLPIVISTVLQDNINISVINSIVLEISELLPSTVLMQRAILQCRRNQPEGQAGTSSTVGEPVFG
jgi:hypothetical protein